MSEGPTEVVSFDRLAESFVARLRRGERPALSEYVNRHPEHAGDIVDLFPALAEMEGLKPSVDNTTGLLLPDGAVGCAPNPNQLGDYRILRLIGQGGMGVVYEARRESLSAHVALKVLHSRFRADGSFVRRFRNEARAAARLHHTNIVPVFDFGEHDGILYYVMQYIPGQGLDRVLADVKLLRESGMADGPAADPSARLARSVAQGLLTGQFVNRMPGSSQSRLPTEPDSAAGFAITDVTITPATGPPEPSSMVSALGGSGPGAGPSRYHREIARIGAQVADALAHAHSLGILHRDIKPPNLLLDARGSGWVTDFGLAKCEDAEAALTDPGDVLGTLRYMAPERLSGHSDRSGDTYALGATLYEMLALRPVFDARDRMLLVRQILHDEPRPLRTVDPRVSRDLETIVRKAMAKEIGSRYASAAEMSEDLRLYLEDRPLKNARHTTNAERSYRWCRRNPLAAGLGAAAAALLLAILVVSTVAAIREKTSNANLERELKNVEAAKTDAMKQLARAEVADREKGEKLWEANLATARASRYSGRPGRRFDALAALARAAELGRQLGHQPESFSKLRNEAIAALALPDLKITKEFGRWTSDLVSVDVNADFDLFATSDHSGRCIVRRIADDVEVARLPPTSRPRTIVFGADRWLADVDPSGSVKIWDIAAPVPEVRVDDRRAVAGQDYRRDGGGLGPSLDFRPDGGLVAILHADGSLTTHELPSGKRRLNLPPRPISLASFIRLHPRLPYLILTSAPPASTRIIHLETGASAEVKIPWSDGGSYRADWSDDGRTLTIPGNYGQGIAIYEFTGDPPVARLLKTGPGVPGWSSVALNRSGDRLFSRGENHATVMTDLSSGRVLFSPPNFVSLPYLPPILKADRERRRLFPARVDDPVRRFGYWSVAEGQECRLIVPDSPKMYGIWVGISPDARLAMGVSDHRVLFYDLDRGREAGSIPFGDLGTFNFYVALDPSGCLLTSTFDGCFRWPVRPDTAAPGTVVVGPPERLGLTPSINQTSVSRDGKVIAQARISKPAGGPQDGGWLLHPGRGEPARNLHPGQYIGHAHVTPDGKWAAFGGSPGPVFVHDAETGEQVWSRPGVNGYCQFSPDGKWLGTDIDNGRLFAVGTWQPGPQLGHGFLTCFSRDGKLAILSTGEGPLRLVEVATGREVARFEDPDKGSDHAALSADGATLVSHHNDGLRVWDLRLIRSELSKIGLDWDAPPFPPKSKAEGPLTVKIVGADLLDPGSAASRVHRLLTPLLKADGTGVILACADDLIRSGWHDAGLAIYDASIRRDPAAPRLRMHRGLEYFQRRRWEAAAEDFRLALAGELPGEIQGQARIRLACVYHELGRHADAASTLATELEEPSDTRNGVEQVGLRLLLAEFFDLVGQPNLARKQRGAAAKIYATPALAANNLAWEWLVPKARSPLGDNERNITAAVLLARKAVALAPGEAIYGNTYGLALYRDGRIAEARSVLEANLALGKGSMDAWDLFPLAMCQHRLGDPGAARISYDRAVAWSKSHAGRLGGSARELADLEAEAGRLVDAAK